MPRDETTEYQQDRLGNERRKLDKLRAQEGMDNATDSGLLRFGSSDTGTDRVLYSFPSHVDESIVLTLHAFNSVGSGDNTFWIGEADLDSNGNISSTTQRSVPINVASGNTKRYEYEGLPFSKAISVQSEFEGWVGVGLVSDHKKTTESNTSI